MEKCTVVVTGASGLLGRSIMSRFSSESLLKVIGTVFSRTAPNCVKVDLMDSEQIESFIADTKPDILIHSAAQRFPDKMAENPEEQKIKVSGDRNADYEYVFRLIAMAKRNGWNPILVFK